MPQKSFVFLLIGLVAGLAIGFFGTNALNRNSAMQQAAESSTLGTAADPSQPVANTGGMMPDVAETLAAAERDPQNFAAQMKTGDMYAQIGRFDRAVEFYKRGIALKPDDIQANVVLANALFDSRQFEEAEAYYTKAVQMNPKDLNARTDLGATFVERNAPDYDRAIREFEEVLAVDSKHEPSLYYLGITFHRKGDTENARKTLERLQAANPSSGLIDRLKQNLAPKETIQ